MYCTYNNVMLQSYCKYTIIYITQLYYPVWREKKRKKKHKAKCKNILVYTHYAFIQNRTCLYYSVSSMIFYNALVLTPPERNIKETIFTVLRGFGHTYGSGWLGHALTTSLWNLKQCSRAERSSWGKSTYQQQFRSDPVLHLYLQLNQHFFTFIPPLHPNMWVLNDNRNKYRLIFICIKKKTTYLYWNNNSSVYA